MQDEKNQLANLRFVKIYVDIHERLYYHVINCRSGAKQSGADNMAVFPIGIIGIGIVIVVIIAIGVVIYRK